MGRLLAFFFACFALAAFAREDSSPRLLLDLSYRETPTPTATPTPTPAAETNPEEADRDNAAERRSR